MSLSGTYPKEGITASDDRALDGGIGRFNGNGTIPPGIVGVGADLHTRLGVNAYDVSKTVFFKIIGVEYVLGITRRTIPQTNWIATLIIKIHKHPLAPCFADNLGAVEGVGVKRTANVFAGSDALVVIGKAITKLPTRHTHLHKLTAVPGHGVAVVGQRVANTVVSGSRQLVSPGLYAIGIFGWRWRNEARLRRCKLSYRAK